MIGSIVILAVSLVLFAYWFRYTCLLILNAKTAKDYTGQVAQANQLSFLEVQRRLEAGLDRAELATLHDSLERDYRLLTYLLRHAAHFQAGGYDLEQRMLMVDYRAMQLWYALSRRFGVERARGALQEMSDIIGHFANDMGERLAASTVSTTD